MTIPKYSIGSTVWWASTNNEAKYIQCPDCFGKKYIKVELADETKTVLTIHCEGCKLGYELPSGLIKTWEAVTSVRTAQITGVELTGEGVEYRAAITPHSSYHLTECDLFDTQEAAQDRANVIAEERTAEEAARYTKKEKPAKSWAWHVAYHRGCLKRAQKDVEYHTSQLDAAKAQAKGAA